MVRLVSATLDEAVTLSDTTLAASVLNTLDGMASGTVYANTVTTLTGTPADVNTAYGPSGISNSVMKRHAGGYQLADHISATDTATTGNSYA